MAKRSGDPLDEVVDAVRRGDGDAIAAVYLQVAPALRGYLLRRVSHGEVADDLVEQTFLELIEGCTRIRGDGRSLRAWLYRAARNNLTNWRRRAARRADHELRPGHEASLRDDADPADAVARLERDPQLVAALAQLTDAQREVIELRLVAELSLAQVAELTGRSLGAVKLLQHRGLRRLSGLLSADEPQADP